MGISRGVYSRHDCPNLGQKCILYKNQSQVPDTVIEFYRCSGDFLFSRIMKDFLPKLIQTLELKANFERDIYSWVIHIIFEKLYY